jgi:hypothetical protein
VDISKRHVMGRALAQQARLRRSATLGWCPGKVSVGVELLVPRPVPTLRDGSVGHYPPECLEEVFCEVRMRRYERSVTQGSATRRVLSPPWSFAVTCGGVDKHAPPCKPDLRSTLKQRGISKAHVACFHCLRKPMQSVTVAYLCSNRAATRVNLLKRQERR